MLIPDILTWKGTCTVWKVQCLDGVVLASEYLPVKTMIHSFFFSLLPSIFFICCFVWNARCFYLLDWSLQQRKYYAYIAFAVLERFSFVYKAVLILQKSKISIFFVLTFFMRILTPHCFELFYPGTSLNVGRKVAIGKISVLSFIYVSVLWYSLQFHV